MRGEYHSETNAKKSRDREEETCHGSNLAKSKFNGLEDTYHNRVIIEFFFDALSVRYSNRKRSIIRRVGTQGTYSYCVPVIAILQHVYHTRILPDVQ